MDPIQLRRSRNGASIVFVHGILSGPVSAWKNQSGTFWPRLVSDDVDLTNFGVYLYAYRADALSGSYSLEDAVDAMRDYLRLDGVLDDDPNHLLIFVCHSMGGILARRYVVANQLELVERKTKLALFLVASPSLGTQYANFVAAVAPLYNAQLDVLRFSETNQWLNTLDRDFLNLKEGRKLLISGRELVEDQFMAHRSLLRFKQIVPPWTGAKYFGNPIKIPGSDHITIAKPSGPLDLQHRLLVDFVKTLSQEVAQPRSRRTRNGTESDAIVVDWGKLMGEGDEKVVPPPDRRNWLGVAATIGITLVLVILVWLLYHPKLGTVAIRFENTTGQPVQVSDQAEYYISAPGTPGMNKRVDSGVLRLVDTGSDDAGGSLEIPSGMMREVKARFVNEDKVMQYYERGDFYVQLIFSARPRPISAEFNFDQKTFEPGLNFTIVPRPYTDLPAELISSARVVFAVGPSFLASQNDLAHHLGVSGIMVSGFVQFAGQPSVATCTLIYYNDADQPLADAIKTDLNLKLSTPLKIVKGSGVSARRGVIDIFLDNVGVKQ
ncbi:alpha/beta fold hydrolase [Rhizobium laguerreae]|uniref:alpha/beta fold hydrolase n=1 Tax=Rhizobium laguerreae TaxID=1076926 RepID=UPI00300A8DB7